MITEIEKIFNLLAPEEQRKLNKLKDELEKAWHTRQMFRTETEARYGVLNDFKFPTRAAKYWQSVREQMGHFEQLIQMLFAFKRLLIDQEEKQEAYAHADEGFEKRRMAIDLEEIAFSIKSTEQILKHRVREVLQWSQIKKELDDGSFDTTDPNTHQKESLFKRVLNSARVADKAKTGTDELLSIKGLLHALKDEPINKQFLENLEKNS